MLPKLITHTAMLVVIAIMTHYVKEFNLTVKIKFIMVFQIQMIILLKILG